MGPQVPTVPRYPHALVQSTTRTALAHVTGALQAAHATASTGLPQVSADSGAELLSGSSQRFGSRGAHQMQPGWKPRVRAALVVGWFRLSEMPRALNLGMVG